jgi:nucleotide-binding universal stress UspA family protein
MASSNTTRILVVTDRAAATPGLLDTIRGRAARGPAEFRILVPNPAPAEWHPTHPERHDKAAEAERVLTQALPLVEEAAGHAVEGFVSTRHDPMDVIEETLHDEPFDEIILATRPHNLERWLHVDLPHRVAHLGLPVTTVTGDRQTKG